jgi:hypothetical protein
VREKPVLAALVGEHVLQPGLDPEGHRISECANGSPGWVMTVGFVAWALALATGVQAVRTGELRPAPVPAGVRALLGVAATGAPFNGRLEDRHERPR